jgi:hypothetical protein
MLTKASPSGSSGKRTVGGVLTRGNRLRRAGLVLALLVLAAIVTGVAASATTTVIPDRLTGRWERGNGTVMTVGARGKVNISGAQNNQKGWWHTKFSRVTSHRLTVSAIPGLTDTVVPSCSRTGTYRWTFTTRGFGGHPLKLTKIHDPCEPRVGLLTGDLWGRAS